MISQITYPVQHAPISDKHQLIRHVQQQDLLHYQTWEIIKELSLPLPWLLLSLYSSQQSWYGLTLIAAFYFFLTGLRVTHNAFHYALGLTKMATDAVMFVLSILMLGSLHAVQYTHIQHHKHCLQEGDIEGSIAKQSFWQALLMGPLFPYHVHKTAWQACHGKQKQWIKVELVANALWLTAIWLILDSEALKIHSILMMIAYCFSAFFAVWTVHHDCDTDSWNNSRTLRSVWKSLLFYNMFYHIEHHLFPRVPTCHLPELAKRLDKAGCIFHSSYRLAYQPS